MGCALSLSKSVDSQQQRRGRNKKRAPKKPYPTEQESLLLAQRVRDRHSELCDLDDRIALARLNTQRARRDEAELVDSVASSPLPLPHPRYAAATGPLGRSAVKPSAASTTPVPSSAAASPTLVGGVPSDLISAPTTPTQRSPRLPFSSYQHLLPAAAGNQNQHHHHPHAVPPASPHPPFAPSHPSSNRNHAPASAAYLFSSTNRDSQPPPGRRPDDGDPVAGSMTQPVIETTEDSDAGHSLWHHQRSETTHATPDTLFSVSVGPLYAPAAHPARSRKPACVFDLLRSQVVEDGSDDDVDGATATTTTGTRVDFHALPRSVVPPSSTPSATAATDAYRRQPHALESLRRKLMPLQFFAGSVDLALSSTNVM